jgi:ribosome-binding factor A
MNIRQKRLADAVRTVASEIILEFEQAQTHPHGIITLINVEITTDYSYGDIYVSAQYEDKNLPHFIAPTAHDIERTIGKKFALRKVPHIRFKLLKEAKKETHILELINTLDHQYGLSQVDS